MKIIFKDIFLMDNWHYEDAINYLAGIYDITEFDDGNRVYTSIDTLDFEIFTDKDVLTPIVKTYLSNANRYIRIWDSGHHAQLNSPSYYIDWAISKSFDIPWLNDAIEQGFYRSNQLHEIDKSITEKERETLLVIIAALAKEAKIDIEKISKAGDLIANMTQLIGAPIGATTIETHLKKINQAIVNRTK